jgi:diacylglycerol O-acyltransferase / wax synthase
MEQIPLGRQDAQMLLGDSQATPMHIGGFAVYSLPTHAPDDYVGRLVARLRQHPINNPPWNYRLAKQSMLASTLAPAWEITRDEDVGYHVSHHVLPAPGGERQLGELISSLHTQPLDMTRPLWEWHIIEGYAHGRFIIYQKVHHALFDGSSTMKSANSYHSETPDVPARGPWTLSHQGAHKDKKGRSSGKSERTEAVDQSLLDRLSNFQESIQKSFESYRAVPELVQAVAQTIKAAIGDESGLVAPYTGPPCILNGTLTRRRRIATQAFDLARVKAVAKASESTLNDVVLAISGGALRRYLGELKALPKKSLTAGIPIALKHEELGRSGNQVAAMFATLATDVGDPFRRLMAVRKSTQAGKRHLLGMTDTNVDIYSTLVVLPSVAGQWTGKAMSNVPVSNVPGPRVQLFFDGAPLMGSYPTPVLVANMALNITFVSFYKGLYMGLSACPDLLPNVQNLALYTGEAFNELEAAVKLHAASGSSTADKAKPAGSAVRKPRSTRGGEKAR